MKMKKKLYIILLQYLVALQIVRVSSADLFGEMLCEPCTCYHGSHYTLIITCEDCNYEELNWRLLPPLPTYITYTKVDRFGFNRFPSFRRNVTEEIKVSETKLEDINFSQFFRLKKLEIDSVEMVGSEGVLEVPKSVLEVIIKGAGISSFDIPPDHDIRILELPGNLLDFIPVAKSLSYLNLRNNSLLAIKSFHCAPMKLLTHLDLSLNQISDIGENALSCILEQSQHNRQNLSLNFAENLIRTIHPRAFVNLVIRKIDLSKNKLRSIDAAVLDWGQIVYTNLQMNPWQCDCESQWMIDELIPILYKSDETRSALYDFRCQSPAVFKNKPLVYWLHRSAKVFCEPGSYSLALKERNPFEIKLWSTTMIICIVVTIVNIILIIAIIVMYCQNRRNAEKRKKLRSNHNYEQLLAEDEKSNWKK